MSQPLIHASPAPARRSARHRSRFAALGLLLVVGAVGTACSDGDDDESTSAGATESSAVQQSETPAPSSAAVAPPATTEPAQPPVAEPEPPTTFVMPDYVGLDLQTAQDLVQTNGVFYSVSHDLLGSRNQVIDSNWVVCTQNIPAGQSVSTDAEGEIDFGVVKSDERCP